MSKYLEESGLQYFWNKLKVVLGGKVDKETGKGLSSNDYTTSDKTKLDGIENGANNYSLPIATNSTLGGVKIGFNIACDSDGTIHAVQNVYRDFVKSGASASNGLVPKPPTTAGTTKYLCEDATWKTPSIVNGVTWGDLKGS